MSAAIIAAESAPLGAKAHLPMDERAPICDVPDDQAVPPSPPAEKATARQQQTGQASTGDGARDCGGGGRYVKDKPVIHIWYIAGDVHIDSVRGKGQTTCNWQEAGALAGSTVTPVMCTPDENSNS